MNVLLIGGSGSLINSLIVKFKKEGHRIFLLTGDRYKKQKYEPVFERYNFAYSSENLQEIMESVRPDITIYTGAFDPNYRWMSEERETVRFTSDLMNVLVAYSTIRMGKFIFLSSHEVYEGYHENALTEDIPPETTGYRGTTLIQAEEICNNCSAFRKAHRRFTVCVPGCAWKVCGTDVSAQTAIMNLPCSMSRML